MSACIEGSRKEDYNLPLHLGALFIILGVSAGACALPLAAIRLPMLHIPPKALFLFRHFGTGVLVATAFVHLLPTAFLSLTDPCLPTFYRETYPALAGAIALASVFLITIAEMVFSPGRSLCSGPGPLDDTENAGASTQLRQEYKIQGETPAQTPLQFELRRSGKSHKTLPTTECPVAERSAQAVPIEDSTRSSDILETIKSNKEETEQRQKLLMQCLLLECGILFHSVFIGMALAVAVGREQIILLVAIAFHQCFEGLALGSRIAAVGWHSEALQPWLMALAYGCTTPLGQAVGIGTRNLYSPTSQTGLLMVGIMNAISAGLLTYTSLVDLLSEDFLSDRSWRTMRGSRRVIAMSLVFFGAFCMSLIGAWA